MNVVDSSGWLEYFADSPYAENFDVPLQDIKNLIVPTICLYEVFKVVLRERGEEDALQAVATMRQGKVVDLTQEIAIQAAKNSYDFKIPMADSIILTTARLFRAVIWTKDRDFKKFNDVQFFP